MRTGPEHRSARCSGKGHRRDSSDGISASTLSARRARTYRTMGLSSEDMGAKTRARFTTVTGTLCPTAPMLRCGEVKRRRPAGRGASNCLQKTPPVAHTVG
jgi:hypothetical protein